MDYGIDLPKAFDDVGIIVRVRIYLYIIAKHVTYPKDFYLPFFGLSVSNQHGKHDEQLLFCHASCANETHDASSK